MIKTKEFVIEEPLKLTILNDSLIGRYTKVYFNDQEMSKHINHLSLNFDANGMIYADITFFFRDGSDINIEMAKVGGKIIVFEKDKFMFLRNLWKRIKNIFG